MDIGSTFIGVDEAGRGCLAGPVYAASVVWNKNVTPSEILDDRVIFIDDVSHKKVSIRDSKKLSEKQRELSRHFIERNAFAYAIASVDAKTIDTIGILPATMKAMATSIKQVQDILISKDVIVKYAKIDGDYFTKIPGLESECVVEGDSKILSIAAASILAKTYRDEYIVNSPYAGKYGWSSNKAYGTKLHIDNIIANGYCPEHRMSFNVARTAHTKRSKDCILLLDNETNY
jgi:ribonuclease HII